jgi:hypothetical protein
MSALSVDYAMTSLLARLGKLKANPPPSSGMTGSRRLTVCFDSKSMGWVTAGLNSLMLDIGSKPHRKAAKMSKEAPRATCVLTALLALLLANALSCKLALAAEEDYATIGWWKITYREVDSLRGCQATARFQDNTEIEMALVQETESRSWVVFIIIRHGLPGSRGSGSTLCISRQSIQINFGAACGQLATTRNST